MPTQLMDERQVARSLRFIAVRGYLESGAISEEQAVELLQGCLSPGDESTRVDDSELLQLPLSEQKTRLGIKIERI